MHIRIALLLALSLNAPVLAQSTPANPAKSPPDAPAEKPAPPDAKTPPEAPVEEKSAPAPKAKSALEASKGVVALNELNVFWKGVSEKNRSANVLFPAWIAATPMPSATAPSPEDIWPGMEGFAEWKKWVAANPALRDAIMKAQNCFVLGIPYGEEGLDPKWKAKGIAALPGSAPGEAALPYLNAMRGLTAYTAVSMYVDAEAKKFDPAFDLSLAMLRVLRQVSEQRMEAEKMAGMNLMSRLLEANRVYMAANLEQLPVATLQRMAIKGYPYIKPGDNERLKRLELPEGDRIILTESMPKAFNASGQPDDQYFADKFGAVQSINSPLTRFGASARWRELGKVHGSLEASMEKLAGIYDDWWRRWRMRFYDPILDVPTQFSKLNQSKYALVTLFVENLQQVFDARLRLIAEIDGTAMSAALCGFYLDSSKQYPSILANAFPIYGMRRMNFDPYSKDYERLNYRVLEKDQPLGTPWGQVQVSGAVLWSVGPDHEDDGFEQHDPADGTGDVVLWPPPRFLARSAGVLK
ncbi:MAG: hypothetical protein K8R92_10660 [Planctomycetes bacterium]|nr:hypothetical protein [Planctomycetota bacterium]